MPRHRGIGMNRPNKTPVHCSEPHDDGQLYGGKSLEQQSEYQARTKAMLDRTDQTIKRTRSFLLQDAREGVTIWKA